MITKFCVLLLLASLGGVTSLSARELQPFEAGSYQTIVEARGDAPFVLAFWSIDCPPCFAELKMLGKLLSSRPFDLVLVSTDGLASATEVGRVLAEFGLEHTDTWLYAAPPERLRFEVDRTWYGELPRSYLFEARERLAISGTLDRNTLETWLARHHP